MTDAELTGLAVQATNMVMTDLRNAGTCGGVIATVVAEGEPIKRLPLIEKSITDTLGEDWLSDQHKKRLGFAALKLMFRAIPPAAVVYGTGANFFMSNEKLNALAKSEAEALINQHGAIELEQLGYGSVTDSIVGVAQDHKRIVVYSRPVKDGEWSGEPFVNCMDLEDYRGNTRVF